MSVGNEQCILGVDRRLTGGFMGFHWAFYMCRGIPYKHGTRNAESTNSFHVSVISFPSFELRVQPTDLTPSRPPLNGPIKEEIRQRSQA